MIVQASLIHEEKGLTSIKLKANIEVKQENNGIRKKAELSVGPFYIPNTHYLL